MSHPTQQFLHNTLSSVDARLLISGGSVFAGAADAEYDARVLTKSATIISSDGAGSEVNLPSVQTINAGWDDVWSGMRNQVISADNGGTVDFSGVTQIIAPIRVEDRLDIIVNNDGANNSLIDLGGLQTLSSARDGDTLFDIAAGVNLPLSNLTTASNAQFDLDTNATLAFAGLTSHDLGSYALASGAAVNAPVLTAMTNVSLTLANGSQFDGSASLVDISGSTVTLSHPTQQFLHNTLSSVDARLLISGGSVFAGASDTEYDARVLAKSATIISSDGAGSEVNLPSVQIINAGWDDVWSGARTQVISASNGGTVDLSGVTQIISPWRTEDSLDIIAETGGLIDLSSLQSVAPPAGRSSQTHLSVQNAGTMIFGDMPLMENTHITVADLASTLDINGSAQLTSGSFTMAGGATVTVSGNFAHEFTDETNLQAASAIMHMDGAGTFADPQLLEVGGLDAGLGDPGNDGNFGFGQLILGTDLQPTVVSLIDVFDNGNRASPEALYLFGLGGPDGLLLKGDSTLVIGDIPVYAKIDGDWTLLNDLFPDGVSKIDFAALTGNPADMGHVALPEPATLSLLALGGLAILRRRRKS